jgi:hypothetical protein
MILLSKLQIILSAKERLDRNRSQDLMDQILDTAAQLGEIETWMMVFSDDEEMVNRFWEIMK